MDDLVASIRNKNNSGGGLLASLGARYGVDMDDTDPLDDQEFARVQAGMGQKQSRK